MQIQIIDNVERNTASILVPAITNAFDIRIAVAFVSGDGLSYLLPSMRSAIEKKANIEFLVGMDPRVTDPYAVRDLYNLLIKSSTGVLLCFVSRNSSAIYHPKIYLAKDNQNATAIIGSSNLTRRGLVRNIEANVVIKDQINSEIMSEIYTTFTRLKYHPDRVIPDDEFLDIFFEICQKEKSFQSKAVKDKEFQKLKKTFIEKAMSLERPKPTKTELIGWLEMVYNSIPEGKFTNQDVYKFETQFRERYPQNQNIKAKIRQQLQILRQLGFIEHLSTGVWEKKL